VLRFIVRRVLGAIPVLFGLSVILFMFLRLLPGDPALAILGQHATPQLVCANRRDTWTSQATLRPVPELLGPALQGNFGSSIIDNRSVAASFALRFPITIELTIGALVFAVGLGIPLGRLAARHPNGWIDGFVTVLSLFGISIPIFVLGYTLVFIFGVELHWLPSFGPLDPRLDVPPVTNFPDHRCGPDRESECCRRRLCHLVLPAIALGSIPLAIVTRITRASVIDVSNEDYVRTARAKGLTESRVNDRHIMRNAWLPVITVIGLQVGSPLPAPS